MSLDALDDPTFRAMNDVDFPVPASSRASTRRRPRDLRRQDQCRRQTRPERTRDLPLARHFRASGHIVRFIEYMDVGPPMAGGWSTSFLRPRSSPPSTASFRSSRSCPTTGRSRRALALPRQRERSRRHCVGHPGVLPRLHPRAVVDRRQDLHLPVCQRGLRPAGAAARRISDAGIANAIAALWRSRSDRSRSSAAPKRRARKDRDVVYRGMRRLLTVHCSRTPPGRPRSTCGGRRTVGSARSRSRASTR